MTAPDQALVLNEDAGGEGQDRAVVIGASMAGLLAARVLAEHFAEVVVVDRDHLPPEPAVRKGVPQARHLHVLLARGLDVATQLFPGIDDELVAAGAMPLEWPTDALWLTSRGWMKRFSPGIRFVSSGRELLESTIRHRVAALPNVRFLDRHEVTGLIGNAHRRGIAGVDLRARPSAGEDAGVGDVLPARLVVDASGRHSQAPKWLQALGYEPPREERVDAFLGYASRDFRLPGNRDGDWKAIMIQAKPPQTSRTGYLFQIAPDRWRLSLMGAARDYPPTEEAGFLAFVRGLRSPLLAEVINDAEPLTPIFGYQQTANQRRFYERLDRAPEGFLVTGDALFAFNPVYGQGMTAAAQAAVVLDRLLREGDQVETAAFRRRFQREVAQTNAGAWLIATGEDLRYPTTEGGARNLQTWLTHRYLDRVMRAATQSRLAHFGFLDVIQLVAPPTALFKPAVLVPALLRGGEADRTALPPLYRASDPRQQARTSARAARVAEPVAIR